MDRAAALNGRPPSKAYDNHLIPFFGAAPATVNRHLEARRRAFTVAVQDGALASRPHIPRLQEHNVNTGFFERAQFEALRRHLPRPRKKARTEAEVAVDPLVAVVTFGWITEWRLGEVLGLRWRYVDLTAGVVRLEPGTTSYICVGS